MGIGQHYPIGRAFLSFLLCHDLDHKDAQTGRTVIRDDQDSRHPARYLDSTTGGTSSYSLRALSCPYWKITTTRERLNSPSTGSIWQLRPAKQIPQHEVNAAFEVRSVSNLTTAIVARMRYGRNNERLHALAMERSEAPKMHYQSTYNVLPNPHRPDPPFLLHSTICITGMSEIHWLVSQRVLQCPVD